MKSIILNFAIFVVVLFGSNYWHLWYKLGPSILKDILNRIRGKKEKLAKIRNPKIEKFLKKLNYQDFYVIKSPIAFGMAHPLSKEVVISSKIYESGNFNLIKYVLAHEIAHKRQRNTRIGIIYFIFCIVCFLLIYFRSNFSLLINILLAIFLGRIGSWGQIKFEDMADRETARILGKKNTAKAIHDIFLYHTDKDPFRKRNWLENQFFIGRDYPRRIENIQKAY